VSDNAMKSTSSTSSMWPDGGCEGKRGIDAPHCSVLRSGLGTSIIRFAGTHSTSFDARGHDRPCFVTLRRRERLKTAGFAGNDVAHALLTTI
jgi:hypothetical protein